MLVLKPLKIVKTVRIFMLGMSLSLVFANIFKTWTQIHIFSLYIIELIDWNSIENKIFFVYVRINAYFKGLESY